MGDSRTMGMGMNDDSITRIAGAINVLRPDWGRAGLIKLMHDDYLVVRPAQDVALALTWIATDKASRKPTRVLEYGPWWQINTGVRIGASAPDFRPLAHDDCHDCGRSKTAHPIGGCTYTAPPRGPVDSSPHTAAIRAALTPPPAEPSDQGDNTEEQVS